MFPQSAWINRTPPMYDPHRRRCCFTTYQHDPPASHPFAWIAESPAGSDDPIGFSSCMKDGKMPEVCSWNDTSQAEVSAH